MANITKSWLLLICCLLSFLDFGDLAPAFGNAFRVGSEEQFSFSNVVLVGNAKNVSTQVGYRLQALVTVGAVWGTEESRLLKIQIQNPLVVSQPDGAHGTVESTERPFYVWWNLGQIRAIYFAKTDSEVPVRNWKKSIAALFQYQLLDGTYEEEDPSGRCESKYTSHSSTRYHKSKGNCRFDTHRKQQRTEHSLQCSVRVSRSTEFTVSTDGALQTMVSREFVKYLLNAYDTFGGHYESTMQLDVVGSAKQISTLPGSSIEEVLKSFPLESATLAAERYGSVCSNNNCEGIVASFKKHKNSLTDSSIGTEKSSTALVELLQSAREATVEEWLRILKAKSSQNLKGQLLDLLGAVQTLASHEAAKSEFGLQSDEDTVLAERYLQALAVASRPRKEIIEDLLQLLLQNEPKSVPLTDSLIQSLASMTRRYAQIQGYELPTVQNVEAFLTSRLQDCAKDGCKLRYIRGLHNLQSPKSAHVLLQLVQESPRAVSVAAMKALRSFSTHLWNNEYRSKFEDIFFQVTRRYDSSARALALDILLDMRPNYYELVHLLQFLKSNDKSFELKQYLLQKVRMLSEQCTDFASLLKSAIDSDPTLNNYHVLVPKGLSTALRRKFSAAPTFNASLTSLQEMSGGVLKRGIVDLTLDVADERMSLFTLGLYAGGLASFVSSNEEEEPVNDDAEEEETTAGMELSVQGTVMRPLVFFTGKGELMGHVWSGTASERTPAYQGTTLLQDNEEWFHSHNGATLRLAATGAISIDLNGQVTMSLWGRNAQSKVEQNIGITMKGTVALETGFATTSVSFSAVQEPQLHLTSALDFSNDPALCMQLVQPKSTMKQQFIKSVSLAGLKQNTVRKTSRLHHLSGLTHALNRKNNDMCNLIAKS